VDSPGGTVIDSEEIHAKILELKEAGVTVVVSMGATAASGGYYISAPADFIFASPSTITGSLGVIFSVPNFQKAADWIGYKENTITSGKMKDIGSPLREMTAEERGVFQALVDESYEQFVKVIADGRGLSKAEVLKLADGRIYSGKQAQKLGLVDELGSLEDATAYMVDLLNYDDYRIVRYLEPFSFDSLFQGFITAQDSQTATVLREFFPKVSYEPQLLYLYH
jgi:protease-4